MRSENAFLRVLGALGLAVVVAFVAGCGGGGGGGGGSSTSSNAPSLPANQVPVTVAQGLSGVPNLPTVSVTVCAPGTTTCQIIDNIQVDTMSYGLRLVSSAASQVLGNLPGEMDTSGNQLTECTIFADGYTWGTVRTADVKMGGETASGVPIGILGDSSFPAPSSCTSQTLGGAENTVTALGVNGILGIGVAPYDCGSNCANSASNNQYYSCSSNGGCTGTTLALANQVTNPVAKFATDNNGVILAMQPVGSNGSPSVPGLLTFGIGTQSNNKNQASLTFATDSFGDVHSTTFTLLGSMGSAFFDSGSNAYFFNDSSLTRCPTASSFYCPASTTTRSVTVSSVSGPFPSTTVNMTIANAETLFSTGNFAFNDLAGVFGRSDIIDIGLPFFYGRTVYFGYDQRPLGGAKTPYVAF